MPYLIVRTSVALQHHFYDRNGALNAALRPPKLRHAAPARRAARGRPIVLLRAAVLGANDGIVSTASLVVGVAAAAADKPAILLAGFAGLAAGALSMAAGEYVSVSSQSDTEKADLARETAELATQPKLEREELTQIYVDRGLDRAPRSRRRPPAAPDASRPRA